MKTPQSMRRRAFLGACGGAGAGLLSGCTDWVPSNASGSEADKEPLRRDIEPEMRTDGKGVGLLDSRVDADSITYTDEYTITVVLGNIGQDPIRKIDIAADPHVGVEFTETGRSFEHHKQRGAGQIKLEPGETTIETFGPFEAVASGEWTVMAANNIEYVAPEAKTTFEVLPKTVSVGQSVPMLPGVSMTLEGFHLRDSYLFQYDSWDREDGQAFVELSMAPDGQRFAIPEVSIENEAPSAIYIDKIPQFPYQLGRRQFSITPKARDQESFMEPPNSPWMRGDPLMENTLLEGETVSAWLCGRIEVTDNDEVVLEFRQVENTGPPEAIFENPDPKYPQFELVDFSTPERFVEGPQPFDVRVKNVGAVSGEFHGLIQYNEGSEGSLLNPPRGHELTETIDAGEEATITVEYDHEPWTQYQLLPFNEQAQF